MKSYIFKEGRKKLIFPLLSRILKWHIYYIFKKPFPLISVFYITNRCNLKCKMCNIWRNIDKNTIPIDKFKRIVDDLSKSGCCYLSFSGGEPLLVKDIFDRLKYAKERVPYVHMVTNGYLLDNRVAKEIGKIGLDDVAISIDGVGSSHDELRGVRGSFDNAINAIKNLKIYSPNTKIVINTIISPFNINELYSVVELAEQLGVYQKFQPINIHPNFEKQKTKSVEWNITKSEIEELKKFIRFAKKKKFIINSNYFLDRIPNYFSKNLKQGIFNEDCKLPYFYCEFNEKGEIFPCLTAMDWKNGFTFKESLMNVLHNKFYKQKQSKLEKCRVCQRDMYICYLEPRMLFPITKYFKYTLFK